MKTRICIIALAVFALAVPAFAEEEFPQMHGTYDFTLRTYPNVPIRVSVEDIDNGTNGGMLGGEPLELVSLGITCDEDQTPEEDYVTLVRAAATPGVWVDVDIVATNELDNTSSETFPVRLIVIAIGTH